MNMVCCRSLVKPGLFAVCVFHWSKYGKNTLLIQVSRSSFGLLYGFKFVFLLCLCSVVDLVFAMSKKNH